MFYEKVVVGPPKSFSHSDLLEYVETLLKESKSYEERSMGKTNYSWLRSRSLEVSPYSQELEKFKPVVRKMSSESCAVIAVKLDSMDVKTPTEILVAFKNILEEQYSIQMFEGNVKRAKETKNSKKRRNKVHPELLPPGRQATVSFILN
ncbi:uncharacterized protein LOC135084845 [Ostrinia nubilalis]|uniref:uncharacterized protein LOC135084845 n=1 Tax=Ostrinia nubilalis TaxID=29057 RepID=UPI00308223B0